MLHARLRAAAGNAGEVDPFFADVSLLLHLDGANGSTSITDSGPAGLSVSVAGNAQISTAESQFGDASLILDGAGDYLTISSTSELGMGTGDFTCEAWLFLASAPSINFNLLDFRSSPVGEPWVWNVENGGGNIYMNMYTPSGSLFSSVPQYLSLSTWHHVSIVRSSGTITQYVDGVAGGSGTNGSDFRATRKLVIGANANGSGDFLDGHLDEVRITKGVARYTENFTPPSGPFPES